MKSEEEILAEISQNGEIDPEKWKDARESLLRRLDQNLRTSFPAAEPLNVISSIPTSAFGLQSDQEVTSRISSTLASFDSAPPFTIQRITELILYPNRHHTSRGKYLRALDRTLTVTSTTREYPPADSNGTHLMTDQMTDFPLFSLIPWASSTNPNERYPSPPADSATTPYPMANGINGRLGDSHDPSANVSSEELSTHIVTGGTPPPPIDAVDIGIVPEEVARIVQEGGPPPRSPQDLNVPIDDKEENSNSAMDLE